MFGNWELKALLEDPATSELVTRLLFVPAVLFEDLSPIISLELSCEASFFLFQQKNPVPIKIKPKGIPILSPRIRPKSPDTLEYGISNSFLDS